MAETHGHQHQRSDTALSARMLATSATMELWWLTIHCRQERLEDGYLC